MQLNSIIFGKSKQWLARGVFGVFLLFLFLLTFFIKNDPIILVSERQNFYVDANYSGWFQLGTEKHPFKNLSLAMEKIARKKINASNFILKNGEYSGNIILLENMKLSGESKEGVILQGSSVAPNVMMKNNSSIENITSIGGLGGIVAEGSVSVENCSVKEFKEKGIGLLPSEDVAIIRNSEVFDGENKGIYVQRGRKIYLENNKIHHNHGEGLDIRDRISGVIKNNDIYENSESGIELIVGGSVLDIKNNNIWDNESAGITCQYYQDTPEKGKIFIHSNRIKTKNSEKLAITVKSPSGGEGRVGNYWRDSVTITDDNILEGEIKNRSLNITKL